MVQTTFWATLKAVDCDATADRDAGITAEPPFIRPGKKSAPFPLAVQCLSRRDARLVMKLEPLAAHYRVNNPNADDQTLATLITSHPRFAAVEAKLSAHSFYAVFYGYRIGVYTSKPMAAETVRRGEFKGWRVTRSFREAFHVMVTKAEKNASGIEMQEGDDEDGDIDELPDVVAPVAPPAFFDNPFLTPTRPTSRAFSALSPNVRLERGGGSRAHMWGSGSGNPEHLTPRTPASSTPASVPGVYRTRDLSYRDLSDLSPGLPASLPPSQSSYDSSLSSPTVASSRKSPSITRSRSLPSLVVYQHIRSLRGIEGSRTETDVIPVHKHTQKFSPVIASYLTSHGYTADDVRFLAASITISADCHDFGCRVASSGLSVLEAEWLYDWAEYR